MPIPKPKHKTTSNCLAICGFVASVTGLALLSIGLLTSRWTYDNYKSDNSLGLWYECGGDHCKTRHDIPAAGWLLMLFAMMGAVSVFLLSCQICLKDSLLSILILSTVICAITGMGIMVGIYSFIMEHKVQWPYIGWSLYVTVAAAIMYFTSMILTYLHYIIVRRAANRIT